MGEVGIVHAPCGTGHTECATLLPGNTTRVGVVDQECGTTGSSVQSCEASSVGNIALSTTTLPTGVHVGLSTNGGAPAQQASITFDSNGNASVALIFVVDSNASAGNFSYTLNYDYSKRPNAPFVGSTTTPTAVIAPRISTAYVDQVVQDLSGSLPLILNHQAELRAFVTNPDLGTKLSDMPIRIDFNGSSTYLGDSEPASLQLNYKDSAPTVPLPLQLDESSTANSYSMFIPSSSISASNTLTVLITDENGNVQSYPGSTYSRTFPAQAMAPFTIDVVSLRFESAPSSPVGDSNTFSASVVSALFPTPNVQVKLLPSVEIKDYPFTTLTSEHIMGDMRAQLKAAGASGFGQAAIGLVPESVKPPYGGQGGDHTAYVVDYHDAEEPFRIAHELGHAEQLLHAPSPCGVAITGVDTVYSPKDGTLGGYGWDFNNLVSSSGLIDTAAHDVMGYCGQPEWLGVYDYNRLLNIMPQDASTQASSLAHNAHATRAASVPNGPVDVSQYPYTLSINGLLTPDLIMEPVFSEKATGASFDSSGPDLVQGLDSNGNVLFSQPFAATPIYDGDPAATMFFLDVPITASTYAALRTIVVSANGKSVSRSASNLTVAGAVIPPVAVAVANGNGTITLSWNGMDYPEVCITASDGTTYASANSTTGLSSTTFSSKALTLTVEFTNNVESIAATIAVP